MGSPKKASVRACQETHFDCLPLRDHKPQTPQTKWLRVQDQRRPRRAAPTSLPSFLRGKSRSSRRLSVSWTQTRTVFCPQVTLSQLSTLLANPFLMVRHKACSQRPPDLDQSHAKVMPKSCQCH